MTKFEKVLAAIFLAVVLPMLGAIAAFTIELEDKIKNLPVPQVSQSVPDDEQQPRDDNAEGIPA